MATTVDFIISIGQTPHRPFIPRCLTRGHYCLAGIATEMLNMASESIEQMTVKIGDGIDEGQLPYDSNKKPGMNPDGLFPSSILI